MADAVRHGHAKVAHRLFAEGGSLCFDEAREANELCEAARNGNLETLKLLLQCARRCGDYIRSIDGRPASLQSLAEANRAHPVGLCS